jgi:hypothetical protein
MRFLFDFRSRCFSVRLSHHRRSLVDAACLLALCSRVR